MNKVRVRHDLKFIPSRQARARKGYSHRRKTSHIQREWKNKFLCAVAALRKNPGVQARFLLGPAGGGKTFRCLAEVRAALTNDPAGRPLVFLAPKQATFQLERQLLADGSLQGYTRLKILSFERLARFILDELRITPPEFLSDEGRVMVLRALLLRHADELELFRGSARRPGFAQELGRLLNELQQHQLTPAKLRALAEPKNTPRELRAKLHDLALLLEKYSAWLVEQGLQDGNHLLDFATEVLRGTTVNHQPSTINISGLWLDGFAEMMPQELDLLAAVMPACDRATLAFCLDEPAVVAGESSWLSIWSAVGKTFQQCRQRLKDLPDCKIQIESLKRDPLKSRFAASSALQKLERSWQSGSGFQPDQDRQDACPTSKTAIRLVACPNTETEAAFAAREILKITRNGGRFRDCAVLVRNLDPYHKQLERAFVRYGIPFFLDRRESVAHHPLAELTRGALRTVAFDWQQDDWFATLKAGFSPVPEEQIDDLENAALEFGWRGGKWREPLADEASERLRKIIFPPFEIFSARLTKARPTGAKLAEALRELWSNLQVEPTLERWTLDEEKSAIGNRQSAIHSTVWDQMNAWLDNLALAFSNEPMSLRDWLPVLEAGLANLTVGVVPPALDQVLVGAIDRARNPDLKLALVLGVNETIFPATPTAQTILTDADRDELSVSLGPDLRERLARERYYGYIACTRSSEKLIVTWARQNAEGKTLNPSPFIAHLQRIFPELEVEGFSGEPDLKEAEHLSELIIPLVQIQNSVAAGVTRLKLNQSLLTSAATIETWRDLLSLPTIKSLAETLTTLREPDEKENLSSALAERLYGPVLRSSVSRLEEFAQCPFKFFVRSGLRAAERKLFELDARERGNFQHEILKIFHEQVTAEGKRWRDLEPAEARERIGKIAGAQLELFRDGLFRDSAATLFAARALAESLQDFVAVIVTWLRGQYEFDPAEAELGFGGKDDRARAWEINLDGGHQLALQGRIDRVDLWRDPGDDTALAVVTDYKSGGKKLEKILVENGVQLQLLAYLGALRHWKNPQEIFGKDKIRPAGAFYVNLRGESQSGGSRAEILAGAAVSRRAAYRHTGRFDAGILDRLDHVHARDQFNYRLKNNGELYANSTEALPHAEFEKLLDDVETQLRTLGNRIFSGAAQVDPYRHGKKTPCEYCDYAAACRIDKWTHQYRMLRLASKEASQAD
jgi:ATP-dependent helicase/nuclease subunit B